MADLKLTNHTLTEKDPGLVPALLSLVEPTRDGDPESPLSWTTLSTPKLATELTSKGHQVGAETVAKLLKSNGFSLQANAKTLEGKQHPDRDAQFTYLNAQATAHLDTGTCEIASEGSDVPACWCHEIGCQRSDEILCPRFSEITHCQACQ